MSGPQRERIINQSESIWQTESQLAAVVAQQGLGVIPGAEGAWFSLEAIAFLLGNRLEVKTLQNRISEHKRKKLPLPAEHPIGRFYRYTEFVEALFGASASGGKG